MSEFLEAVEDGVLCSCCGGYVGEATGFAQECDDCKEPSKKKRKKAKSKNSDALLAALNQGE